MVDQAENIVGKTITGVIARAGNGCNKGIVMLQFSDGSYYEFMSPAADRALRRWQHQHDTLASGCKHQQQGLKNTGQMALMGV